MTELEEISARDALNGIELEAVARRLLLAIGEDPERDGLRDTPARYARWWKEFAEYDPGTIETAFSTVTEGQLVEINDIRVWSLCEHHLLPFWADVSIAYVPRKKTLGLSKFARIAHACSHRLQMQERLVSDIADQVEWATESPDVAVMARGEHLCMMMRGIRTAANMSTSVLRGTFDDDPHLRARLTASRGQA